LMARLAAVTSTLTPPYADGPEAGWMWDGLKPVRVSKGFAKDGRSRIPCLGIDSLLAV
jgi:hypothetical protein